MQTVKAAIVGASGYSGEELVALLARHPQVEIVATDFHQSPFPFFKAHMANHHVSMNAHLLPFLAANTKPEVQRIKQAYGGLWSYFVFAGRMPAA